MNRQEIHELLYQALETELGGVQIYRTALQCATNEELRREWQEYLEQTEHHVQILQNVFEKLDLDPDVESPGRNIVHHIGASLVEAMQMAMSGTAPQTAEIIAAECVVHAETKDHMNWELLGQLAEELRGDDAQALKKAVKEAHAEVEDEEDEHLYHTTGWARELWIQALGLKAVLPPPEEAKDVKTAIGAARAKSTRKQLL